MAHKPVLLHETIDYIIGDPNGLYIDCTLGGGGHLRELAARLGDKARIIAIDRDADILQQTSQGLTDDRIRFIHADFRDLKQVLNQDELGIVDGIVIDLGVSSFQLDTPERGFSFHTDSDLDMRMDTSQKLRAWDIINTFTETELANIIFKYGEERFGRRIARAIVQERDKKDIDTTLELVEIIKNAVPAKYRREKHPARKTFQAIRIAVNDELGAVEGVLPQAIEVLKPGGKVAVITFHSLEDRIVKQYFIARSRNCICPDRQPVCTCGGQRAEIKLINRKPITPDEQECLTNNRARSAKLRIAQKI
ncbi:rrna small subunit methyltransferase h [hydrocarbon metagenome]|uniref:Rrna small subunit methyltransferase h n=1 Tax=hydrocarbon metagenome TaxID=938273 RepID=A0A0W8E5C1_9ZZZZ